MSYETDIPQSLAVAAFNGVSMDPEGRGERTRNDYSATLSEDYAIFEAHAAKGNTTDMLAAEFAQYRAGYAKRYRAWLASSSRCISSFITGPSNFPTRRAEKRNDIEHKRCTELIEYRERAKKAIIRNLRPDFAPIMSGDSDAVQRLRAELEKLQKRQAEMKAVNNAHKAYLKDPTSLDATQFSDKIKDHIRNYKPMYSWEPHPFPPYAMSNNNANIRRIEKRIEALSVAKAAPVVEREGAAARIEDDPPANRVRLFFPGKPDESVRSKLKSCGFRWSPTIGAWQAYRNHNTLTVAQQIAA